MIYSEVTDQISRIRVTSEYAYDALGRRTVVQDAGGIGMRTLYDGISFQEIRAGETFTDGSLTTRYGTGGNTNRGTEGSRYRWIGEGVNGTRTRSSGSEGYSAVTARWTGSGVTLYGNGEAVAISTSTGTRGGPVYLGKDQLGSVRSTTNGYGVLEERYEYDAFGVPYQGDLTQGMNLGYTGKPYDVTTGLYNYGYRDYAPALARFTTVDPIRDGVNWFAYVNNDPVNYVDLWGLEAYVYTWVEDGQTHVNILIPITYEGVGATPEVIAKFNDAIEEGWSGEFGKYTVQTIVTSDPSLGLMNTIAVPVGNYTAKTYVPGPTGTWPSERPGWTAKHEAGHLLGLHDMYDYETGKPKLDDWRGNIMASINGVVEERNIDDILEIRNPDNTIRAGSSGGSSTRTNEPVNVVQNPVKKNR